MAAEDSANDIGIIGIEFYFPNLFVDQSELELHDQVSEGKYTVGLGQEKMAVCSPVEDAISMCLNAFSRLITRFSVTVDQIGRIDVGSESNPDRAKSIKSHLLALLGGPTCIAGSDNLQACYGGTAALLNSAAWLQSSQWETGKLAVVVAGDVAVYDSMSARATGGAGAVAFLLARGCSAPIKLEKHFGHFSTNVYDFYKPDPSTEAPRVDGPLSISAYLLSAINAYTNWSKKSHEASIPLSERFSSLVFHSPYSKIVYKAFCQLQLLESNNVMKIKDISSVDRDEMNRINSLFRAKAECNLKFSKQIGNSYCSSIFFNLICALAGLEQSPSSSSSSSSSAAAAGRIGAFSYGSGSMSTFFSFTFDRGNLNDDWLKHLISDLESNLCDRIKISPENYEGLMKRRKELYGVSDWTASAEDLKDLREGTFYLNRIDSEFRRFYHRKT